MMTDLNKPSPAATPFLLKMLKTSADPTKATKAGMCEGPSSDAVLSETSFALSAVEIKFASLCNWGLLYPT
jgi:hypothetical protein